MKMISRRSAASVLAGLPFVGGAAAKSFAETQGTGPVNAAPPPYPYPSGALNATGQMPQGPKMPEWQAARLAMTDPDMRALLIAAAFAKHRVVTSIDPDLEVLRSFSPMAKITFQRQRNVQRMLDEATEEPVWSLGARAHEFIKKLMWG